MGCVRPVEEQHRIITCHDRLPPQSQECSGWIFGSSSLVIDGPVVSYPGTEGGWEGARWDAHPVQHGMHYEVSVRIEAGRVVRVGWLARHSRMLGVDRGGYGYG